MRALAALVAVLAGAGSVGAGEPGPVAGLPLKAASHLHLLVANNPPFVLDVDSGRVTPIRAPAAMRHGVLWVTAVGGDAGAIVAGYPNGRIYTLRARAARPVYVGRGSAAVPGADGKSIWIKSGSGSSCLIRRVGLDGRRIGEARPVACGTTIESAGSIGLVYGSTRIVDPSTGRMLLRTPYGVLAAAGKRLVLAGPGTAFTLLDTATGARQKLAWPSILHGLDTPSADYQSRFVALGFADPAWQGPSPSSLQAMDVWLFDTQTGALTHLPGMPAFVDLKFTSMEWTHDGRLVILGENGGKGFVAVWKPGAAKLQVKRLHLPRRTSGSDSFAPLP